MWKEREKFLTQRRWKRGRLNILKNLKWKDRKLINITSNGNCLFSQSRKLIIYQTLHCALYFKYVI